MTNENNEAADLRRSGGRRRICRPVPAPSATQAGPAGKSLRNRLRCWRYLVLEPLPGRPLRRPVGRLFLQLRPRARSRVDLVREVRNAARNSPLPPACCGQARSPSRHLVQREDRVGRVGCRRTAVAPDTPAQATTSLLGTTSWRRGVCRFRRMSTSRAPPTSRASPTSPPAGPMTASISPASEWGSSAPVRPPSSRSPSWPNKHRP